jgi:hypothetical protein
MSGVERATLLEELKAHLAKSGSLHGDEAGQQWVARLITLVSEVSDVEANAIRKTVPYLGMAISMGLKEGYWSQALQGGSNAVAQLERELEKTSGEDSTARRYAVLLEKMGAEHMTVCAHDLSFDRLMEDLVIPYEERKPFRVDGTHFQNRDEVARVKIVAQTQQFDDALSLLNRGIAYPNGHSRHVPLSDYPGRLAAIFRSQARDITSDILNVYAEKKKLKLPSKETIKAVADVVVQGLKLAG